MPLPVLRFKDIAHAPRFQLWTDALTFRQMATEALNNYLKSMCVRNAFISACTALEMDCCDALAIPEINRFKEDVNAALRQAGKTAIDFGSGLWQRILKIRDSRHEYAHSGVSISDRFPSVSVAEDAIAKIREAIRDIYIKGRETNSSLGQSRCFWRVATNSRLWNECSPHGFARTNR